MPIYEYRCSKCGKTFEVIQKFSDKPLTRCKFCKGKASRLISHSTFQLKGSGWYLTDYARKGKATESKPVPSSKSDEKSSDSSTKASSKTDGTTTKKGA